MWDQIDILLTADPNLLLEKPVGKTVIKFKLNLFSFLSSIKIYLLSL